MHSTTTTTTNNQQPPPPTTTTIIGLSSQKITITAGSGVAAVGNRGLGNEGLFIEANKEYEGFFFAKSNKAVSLVARYVS